MLSFLTSQAVALSQVKAREGGLTTATQDQVGVAPHKSKSFFKRIVKALLESRMHKGGSETEAHGRMSRDSINK
jgi:hypothetical protein